MTDRQLINYIIQKKRLPLSFDDYSNFFVLILPPMFTALGVVALKRYYQSDHYIYLLFGGILAILSGLFFLYLTIVRLKQNVSFSTITNIRNLDIDQIANLVTNNFKLNRIKIDKKFNRILADTKMTAFSWGERIIIVLNSSEVLVNSRPGSSRQPYTIIKDVRNIKKIRSLIEDLADPRFLNTATPPGR